MEVRHYLRVFSAYVQLHMKTAMEYRTNFFMQSGFMLLNDVLWILIWYFLFSTFGTVNGYDFSDALIIFGVYGFSYGIAATFFGNRNALSEIIMEGRLDFYLTLPIDELFHALIAKSSYDGVADILYAFMVVAVFAPHGLLIALIAGMVAAVVFISFMVLIESLGFWIEHPKSTTKSMRNTIQGFGAWPLDVYPVTARAILYIIPVAFVGTVPAHLVKSFSWGEFGLLMLVAALMLTLALSVWRIGVKRYESGNLIATRT